MEKPFFQSRVVTPEDGAHPHAHGATLAELEDGSLLSAWYAGSGGKANDVAILGSTLKPRATHWSPPQVIADTPNKADGNPVLFVDKKTNTLWLFYVTMHGSGEGSTKPGTGWTTCTVSAITSNDKGQTWSDERILIEEQGFLTRNKPLQLDDGTIILPIQDERDWTSLMLISEDHGKTWERSATIDSGRGFGKGNIGPALLQRADGSLLCYMRTGSDRYRTWASVSSDAGRTWSEACEIDVPNPGAALDFERTASGNAVMALNPVPEGGRERLSFWLSTDDGYSWNVFRDIDRSAGQSSYPSLIRDHNNRIHVIYSGPNGSIKHVNVNEAWIWEEARVRAEYELNNVVPPLRDTDDDRSGKSGKLQPIADTPFGEHYRRPLNAEEIAEAEKLFADAVLDVDWPAPADVERTAHVKRKDTAFGGTNKGLYVIDRKSVRRYEDYGTKGPLTTRITDMVMDSRGTIWMGGPRGLTLYTKDGEWKYITGREGLPVEDVTALAIDKDDRLWIGTSHGVIHYRPYEKGRQWFYRAGKRYLLGNKVEDVVLAPSGMPAYFKTDAGLSCIDEMSHTLAEKADKIEARLNRFHRRLGLVCAATLDDAENPTKSYIIDDDNDGLWTSYHVVAMSSAYAATGNEVYRESAKTGMHAMVILQNASGVPGRVARSVLPAEEGKRKRHEAREEKNRNKREQWRPTPDGKLYWKSDTSSDEIDGHYFALYAYWRHIAQFIPEERVLIEKQVRDITDHLIDNNYQLIDWDGERTSWGFWNPENLNDDPTHYLENGLNAAQILSFLKVAHYVTGDSKYKEHFEYLIGEHGYLNNVLLAKKVFPDMNNHSDNQLGYTAWYPWLQLERDPEVRRVLHQAVRRHYKTLELEGSSFFNFVSATIDPHYVDIEGGVTTLRQATTDRRLWEMRNSHRADVHFQVRDNRHGDPILDRVLPADERHWNRWNIDPFVPDGGGDINQHVAGVPNAPHNVRGFGPKIGGDGSAEDDGGSWLLAYWLGRYHGLIAAP
jgi:predicted neuraminidase